MKKIVILIIIILVTIMMSACSNVSNTINGEYEMVLSDNISEILPSINFSENEDTFVFTMDSPSSYVGTGSYSIEDKTLTAITNDEFSNEYVFEIVDNNTLVFDTSKSSELSIIDKELMQSIENEHQITFKKH